MTITDHQYEDLLADLMSHGVEKPDRTGTGTRSIFGRQLRYDLSQCFPAITDVYKRQLSWRPWGTIRDALA